MHNVGTFLYTYMHISQPAKRISTTCIHH